VKLHLKHVYYKFCWDWIRNNVRSSIFLTEEKIMWFFQCLMHWICRHHHDKVDKPCVSLSTIYLRMLDEIHDCMEEYGHSLPRHIQQGKCSIVQPPQFGVLMISCILLQEDARQPPLEQERTQLKKTMALRIRQQTVGGSHPEPDVYNHMELWMQFNIFLQ
jgi:hypothetical protein